MQVTPLRMVLLAADAPKHGAPAADGSAITNKLLAPLDGAPFATDPVDVFSADYNANNGIVVSIHSLCNKLDASPHTPLSPSTFTPKSGDVP